MGGRLTTFLDSVCLDPYLNLLQQDPINCHTINDPVHY